MPLGLALKQLTGSGSPVDGGGLGGWYGPNATITGGSGGIWNGSPPGGNLTSSNPAGTLGPQTIVAPAGFNGHNVVGPFAPPNASGSFAVGFPATPIPFGSLDFSTPGNAATIYLVLQMTDIGGVGEPRYPLFGYGYDTSNSGPPIRSQQFYAAFDPTAAGGNPALVLLDQDGPTPSGNSYTGIYSLPVGLAGGSTGIMVLQTGRSAGHRFRWQRGDIGPFSDVSVGTVGAFTGPDVWTLCGRYTEDPPGNTVRVFWANAFIGHVYAYAAIHDDSQIAQMESYLGGIWGV